MSSRIDFKNEFLWLYELQKQRVKKLRDAELKSGGAPLPDTTQNIDLLLKILVQILDKSAEESDESIRRSYARLLEDLEAEKCSHMGQLKSKEAPKPSNENEGNENDISVGRWEL